MISKANKACSIAPLVLPFGLAFSLLAPCLLLLWSYTPFHYYSLILFLFGLCSFHIIPYLLILFCPYVVWHDVLYSFCMSFHRILCLGLMPCHIRLLIVSVAVAASAVARTFETHRTRKGLSSFTSSHLRRSLGPFNLPRPIATSNSF